MSTVSNGKDLDHGGRFRLAVRIVDSTGPPAAATGSWCP
jgi:hypothetical protein